jgi:hypothetical protein
MTTPSYNPLDKRNIGASVAEALLSKKAVLLSGLEPFRGAGIYLIYYVGSFGAYAPIAERNLGDQFEAPIYIGKAVPAGARKGGEFGDGAGSTTALYKRMAEHRESIEQAKNLEIQDFFFRHLVVDDIWIPLGESVLINKFKPVWNTIVDGFGNHDPGNGRYNGMRPRWDVIHPGRKWAARCAERKETEKHILGDVEEYIRAHQIPRNPHFFAMQERTEYDLKT